MSANIEQPLVRLDTQNPSYRIVEIFESLQGEGHNTGMPSIFIRLGRCSLACTWCDTDYLKYEGMTLSEILAFISAYTAKNIIITGGEPSIHPQLDILLSALKEKGYTLCIESNALHEISPLIDYIAVSPKYCYAEKYEHECITQADEVRIVVDPLKTGQPAPKSALPDNPEEDFLHWCEQIARQLKAKHYFLSPLEVGGEMNILQTITMIGRLNERAQAGMPHWRLSIQTHKFARIQ
ncbi:MAG: 7-carboxy-7-deazaguanine synthase QueE [Pelistega sp.]|nr:7-carboxy-7-deazaguanine synthase QueE [Pelistega sp.]